MKTFLNLKQYLILFAAIFSLTSCLKSDDPAFQIVATGYINQTVTETGEGENITEINKFSPVIIVYGNDYIASCSATGSSSGIMSSAKLDDYGANWQITSLQASSELPKETYSISATNADSDPATFSLSFNTTTQSMEGKLKGSIDYDSQAKKLTFEFNKVKNATGYLLLLKSSRGGTFYQSTILQTYTESQISAGALSLEESSFASKLDAGTYRITTAAIIGTISSNNISVSVLQEGVTEDYIKL